MRRTPESPITKTVRAASWLLCHFQHKARKPLREHVIGDACSLAARIALEGLDPLSPLVVAMRRVLPCEADPPVDLDAVLARRHRGFRCERLRGGRPPRPPLLFGAPPPRPRGGAPREPALHLG